MINYILRLIVFGQPLLFMFLYEYSHSSVYYNRFYSVEKEKFLNCLLIVSSMVFIFVVWLSQFSFDFYKPNLFVQYVMLVLYAYYRFKNNYNNFLTSLSLAFLIVFLNSYYWELFLHVADYNVSILSGNVLAVFNFRELWHLIVIPFLLSHYDIDKKTFGRYTMINVLIGFIVFIFTFHIFRGFNSYSYNVPFFRTFTILAYFINRFLSLFLLINIIIDGGKLEHKKWWFGHK